MARPNLKMHLAFGYAIVSLLVISFLSYQGMVISSRSTEWIEHSHQVLRHLRDIVVSEGRAEETSRGYALTGEAAYLRAYRTSLGRRLQEQSILRGLIRDESAQRDSFNSLEAVLTEKTKLTEEMVNARTLGGLGAAAATVRRATDMQLTSEVDVISGQMQTNEFRSRALHDADVRRQLNLIKVILMSGTALSVLIVIAAAWSSKRQDMARSLAEWKLRNSEDKYRILLDGVQDYAIFLLDPKGLVISWNAEAERTRGYMASEIIGQHFSCFFLPEDIEAGQPAAALRMAETNGRYEVHAVNARKNGSRFLADITLTALRDQDGNLHGFSEISQGLGVGKESEINMSAYRT